MILYYTFLLICLFYIRGVLSGLSEELLSAKFSRGIRDFSIVITSLQVIFLIFSLIRAIGFDIKKFNFRSDLREMNYDFADSEEIEVNINLNSYKYKRKVRRSLREFVYYLKENKWSNSKNLTLYDMVSDILNLSKSDFEGEKNDDI